MSSRKSKKKEKETLEKETFEIVSVMEYKREEKTGLLAEEHKRAYAFVYDRPLNSPQCKLTAELVTLDSVQATTGGYLMIQEKKKQKGSVSDDPFEEFLEYPSCTDFEEMYQNCIKCRSLIYDRWGKEQIKLQNALASKGEYDLQEPFQIVNFYGHWYDLAILREGDNEDLKDWIVGVKEY